MKNLCKKNNIPTANFGIFDNLENACNFIKKNGIPIVVKADGLAAGKGVSICNSMDDAIKKTQDILEGKFKSSKKVVLERLQEFGTAGNADKIKAVSLENMVNMYQ